MAMPRMPTATATANTSILLTAAMQRACQVKANGTSGRLFGSEHLRVQCVHHQDVTGPRCRVVRPSHVRRRDADPAGVLDEDGGGAGGDGLRLHQFPTCELALE